MEGIARSFLSKIVGHPPLYCRIFWEKYFDLCNFHQECSKILYNVHCVLFFDFSKAVTALILRMTFKSWRGELLRAKSS